MKNFENKFEDNASDRQEHRVKSTPGIVVIGVGGAGGNAVNNMINKSLQGVDFLVANTDAQSLLKVQNAKVIHLGTKATKGLGAGANPEIGKIAAQESIQNIRNAIEGYNMAFITAGMGGGTGTGAAPVIANEIRQKGILTVAVVSKPFEFEGIKRNQTAQKGIEELQKNVDTILIVPNQNLFAIANEKTTLSQAFNLADQVLYSGVAGITDLMTKEGLINLDFADVCTIMNNKGKAMMGSATAQGQNRAKIAANKAISNPLLDKVSIRGAKGVLVSIIGARDTLTLYEIEQATNTIKEKISEDANIIFGAIFDDQLEDKISVSILATGMSEYQKIKPQDNKKNDNIDKVKQKDIIKQTQNKKNYQIKQIEPQNIKQKNIQKSQVSFREIKPQEIENEIENEIKNEIENEIEDKTKINDKIINKTQTIYNKPSDTQQNNAIAGMRKRIFKFFTDISEVDEQKNLQNKTNENKKNPEKYNQELKQKYNQRKPELPSFLRKQK